MPTLPAGVTLGAATPARGRSVLAARAYGPGDTIATFTDPCIAIPESSHLMFTCHYCLAVETPPSPASSLGNSSSGSSSSSSSGSGGGSGSGSSGGKKMRACQGCKTSRYCGAACQKADWALAHGRGECKALRRGGDYAAAHRRSYAEDYRRDEFALRLRPVATLPTPVRALVQVLARPEMAAAVAELEGHLERARTPGSDHSDWTDLVLQAQAALHYLGRPGSSNNVTEAIDIICKLNVNSFNRQDEDVHETGIYINPALAMVNHSCLPNAFVELVGRKAVLHAYRAIKEGEEIEISYIGKFASSPFFLVMVSLTLHGTVDTMLPRWGRRKSLKQQYNFDCACPRCRDDLNIYQVCQIYPHLELNSFSLAPDLSRDNFQEPLLAQLLYLNEFIQSHGYELPRHSIYRSGLCEKYSRYELRGGWKTYAPLRKAEAYAMVPLAWAFPEASIYFSEEGKFTYGLAISCFVALHIDPYRDPMPFATPRIKDMLIIAKFLAHTATATVASSTSSENDGALATRVSEALSGMDQLTMGQTILKLIIYQSAVAHSKEWPVYQQAIDLLNGLESLPGRETENALVDAFAKNPSGSEEMRFFKTTVLEPLQRLAGFALEIMDTEFST
ncbi:hypothetical protein Hte_000130 [Hypoxylon texense]